MNQFEIRKKMLMEVFSHPEYKPMKSKELYVLLGLKKREMDSLREVLEELVLQGEIVLTPRGKYMLPTDDFFKTGKFIGNPSGFGFVEVEGMESDIFIPATRTGGAMHGDTVSVRLLSAPGTPLVPGKRVEGEISKVLKRGYTELTGVFEDSKSFGFVVPDISKIGKDIYIGKGLRKNAKSGDKVVVKLLDYGKAGESPRGEIVEILGDSKSVEVDITSIVRSYDLSYIFPEEAIREARNFSPKISQDEYNHRLDLRNDLVITIDGEDAKDLDDAISIEKVGDNYRLGVHIADVSHFVPEYSALDVEAFKRGTSHYLVDRVIPMLPAELSNGLCSLHPEEDRLTLSCIMLINPQGKVISHEIKESVIRSSYRMTYTEVAKILEPERCSEEEKAALRKKYEWLLPSLYQMADCAKILQNAREHRGSIDFDFTEAKFILNDDSSVSEIKAYERNVATRLIEDFMLIANQTIAEHFFWQSIPFVYRSHGEPKEDKITELSAYLKAMDHPFRKTSNLHPKDLQNLLTEVSGKPEENIIRRMVLRSMQQAKYSEWNEGHFGLAVKYYCHFTSPIRRYPDLQIHRIIKEILQGKWNSSRQEHYNKRLPNVAVKTSALERRADEAEREVHKLLKAHYMQRHIGESFEGIVSGVNQWGIFVELPNTVEGLVNIGSISDDFYEFDSAKMALIGMRYQREYHLGDKVKITVTAVDLSRKVVDFKLYDEDNRSIEKTSGFSLKDSVKIVRKDKSKEQPRDKGKSKSKSKAKQNFAGTIGKPKKQSRKKEKRK